VPLLFCLFLFDEPISLRQWAGLCVLLVAVLILCSYQSTVKAKITLPALALFLFCGLSNGICDLSQKLFVRTAQGASIAAFSLYTYLFSALTLGIILLVLTKVDTPVTHGEAAERVRLPRSFYLYIGIMALCLFCNSYFKTAAASHLSAALLYPLSQGGALILSTLMATFLFRERMNTRGIVGIGLCFLALLMINL
jgi:drug/metabolite transporter (DMT)-like permease